MKTQRYHKKLLLEKFHLTWHSKGFHPQTQKLEMPTKEIAPCE